MSTKPTIGVLALQGCVLPHQPHIEAAGGTFKKIRTKPDFQNIQGLILPGGESTTMLNLIKTLALEETLQNAFKAIPTWGICAGAILMAQEVANPPQKSFGLMPLKVTRNAYGRQLESEHADVGGYPVSYIRAPQIDILKNAKNIEILAKRGHNPTWLRQEKNMVSTFHPELSTPCPSPMHKKFMEMIQEYEKAK